jgi:acyl-coenzyme A synthetase/AMP-(fatty) acid ligase
MTGKNVKFNELEEQSRRVASALGKRGFIKGDVLYFVTYEMAQLYVVQLAVWRLGGAVRGCFQAEIPGEKRQ